MNEPTDNEPDHADMPDGDPAGEAWPPREPLHVSADQPASTEPASAPVHPWGETPRYEAAPLPALPAYDPPVFVPAATHSSAGDLGGLRVLIVAWCFWLLGAWAAAFLIDTSVPRVRWMLFAGCFGLMLVWPVFRLSEKVPAGDLGKSVGQALIDWLALSSVYQAVIWSLYLIAHWPISRGIWLDAALLAWTLLSALIVGVARLWPGGLARLVGMALCVALVFAEPAVVWLHMVRGGEGWAMHVSPLQALWDLTDTSGRTAIAPWDRRVLMIALVAVAGWSAVGLWALGVRIKRGRTEHNP